MSIRPHFLRRCRQYRLSFLSGLLLIIGLFSLLQLLSVGMISRTMIELRQDNAANEILRQQQALMDQARMEAMNASDKLNRAGIYLMFDKTTGSVGSWNSLMSEAEASLKRSQEYYQRLGGLSAADTASPAFTELRNSYQQLYNGLAELADGIKKTNDTDIFFAIPIQAYQTLFTQKYARYLQENDARLTQHTQSLISRLDATQTMFITILGLLLCISLIVWIGVSRVIIRPLKRITEHLQLIAAGDLSHDIGVEKRTTREIDQLNQSVIQMQGGLVALISQVRRGMETMMNNVNDVATDNQTLSLQAQKQSQELKVTTEHIMQLSQHLEQNARYTQQAGHHAGETSHIAEQGETMMNDVRQAMTAISGRSKEMTEVITLIENVAFQTHILSLNASIEAARAGELGRGFAVVAREVGSLASQSSHSAQNINTLIRESNNSVTTGSRLVERLNDSLQEIIQASRGTSTFLNEITDISLQQNDSIHEVTGRIRTLNETVMQNALQVEASAETFNHLLAQAEQLNISVAQFRLPKQLQDGDTDQPSLSDVTPLPADAGDYGKPASYQGSRWVSVSAPQVEVAS
ncbi:methyl-accepting chemotaxis protein [Musicola paradisiaca]|uniref:Methyl-accepting chemotaxis sensory transducer n=1 Tax=Musicola paradisiaca (strain Ech703) TaxID=579405 RepID=C6C5U5_MUSP7|nr:methyl-accepting chemotaxis protein [Musicola paradisiaca]ACS85736.1 methyl-accepting chemotaxis sensory transducer [Musicola paradisiaca Ech703]